LLHGAPSQLQYYTVMLIAHGRYGDLARCRRQSAVVDGVRQRGVDKV
jgi:hypothetical protein